MTGIELRHNPANGPLPGVLARRFPDPATLPQEDRCGRCNRDLAVHVWQMVDHEADEELRYWQAGVIDCEVTA